MNKKVLPIVISTLVISMSTACSDISDINDNAAEEITSNIYETKMPNSEYTSKAVFALNTETEETEQTESLNFKIPECDTSFKSYMSYKAITNKSSDQYKLQQKAWTDEDGFRRFNDDYLVAVGTYYSEKCGTRFKIVLDSGSEFTICVGDIKQDKHTDRSNRYNTVYDSDGNFKSASVLEFIVDTNKLSSRAKLLGSVECYSYLKGNIKSMERIDDN